MIREKIIFQMLVAAEQHFVCNISDDLIELLTNDFEQHLLETGAKVIEPKNFFTVFHVAEYTDKDYNMELWKQVEAVEKDTKYIQFKSIAESEIAYLLVTEHYDNLKFAYDSLFDYVQKQGYAVNGYPRETYIFDKNAPYGYYTEIQLPFIRHGI